MTARKGPRRLLELTNVVSLCRLTLSVATPLSSFTTGFARLGRGDPDVELREGVWEVQVPTGRVWLEVTLHEVRACSRAQAFVALGAVDALGALGLDDAAIALQSGDYELACVQWISGRA